MTRQKDDRQLVPAYHFRGLLIGWRCSVCGHDFRVPMEEATDQFAPAQVQNAFEEHSCAQTLIEQFRSKNAS